MTETPYSNREFDFHFKEVKETLARIEQQTTKTNGRVGLLENWRNYIMGSIAIITFIVIPLISWIFLDKIKSINNMIDYTNSKIIHDIQ